MYSLLNLILFLVGEDENEEGGGILDFVVVFVGSSPFPSYVHPSPLLLLGYFSRMQRRDGLLCESKAGMKEIGKRRGGQTSLRKFLVGGNRRKRSQQSSSSKRNSSSLVFEGK